ncbi:hypothetical protein TNCV_5041701 [Trichonephila clavipes]|nr:hypothetical protein TNCV_5041701 [Trichonephila clavipes]
MASSVTYTTAIPASLEEVRILGDPKYGQKGEIQREQVTQQCKTPTKLTEVIATRVFYLARITQLQIHRAVTTNVGGELCQLTQPNH